MTEPARWEGRLQPEPVPVGPILYRTWSAETTGLRVLTRSEERRRRRRTSYAIVVDLDHRLARLGFGQRPSETAAP